MVQPALFLDRDGVINADLGHVHRPANFVWLAGIFETVRVAHRLGLFVVVVTNQAGIGKGLYTVDDFRVLTDWMLGVFESKRAPIDALYFCPYHPEGIGPYRVADHPDRKPKPGMLLRAAKEHGIALHRSALVGDNLSDLEAAAAAGVANARLFTASASADSTRTPNLLIGHRQVREWLKEFYGQDP